MVHVGWSPLSVGFLALFLAFSINQALSNGVQDTEGCESFQYNYGGALLHHVYQTIKVPGSIYCLRACDDDIRCQSINHVVHGEICELNNRTKEARPKDFTTDDTKVYMKKFRKRAAIGSISQVPAESCNEIKTSEKGRNGKYWLSSIIPGTPVFAYCDMSTGDVDECTSSTPVCSIHFNCINTLGSYRCDPNHSCQGILVDGQQKNISLIDGLFTLSTRSTSFQTYCDMTPSGQAWTLIARFSNSDAKNWMEDSGEWWYDKTVGVGDISNTSGNADMFSPAFWLVRGHQFKITRSDDPQHTALLQTTGDCLGGKTFRAKINSYGYFRNGGVWASDDCQGNCNVQYGGQFQTTDGFGQATCNGSIQKATQVGFWCDWGHGDGAVLLIGGGGRDCQNADHGIGITEADQASFLEGKQLEHDFGNEAWNSTTITKTYSLNLWVN
ncbi:uncharacterized protein LOC122955498 [Acropora millepora]|uniref:uncharacterized protein LOC122955498 n=1 Tax=Acropora millepora TaxID=45264 RepID=UPI001CF3464D|nr:uncharacterized protein LOC122955498 [Acropora millepora]XP_044171177.1 uncharacterized protein LOC122955498 [Acropora millepora]